MTPRKLRGVRPESIELTAQLILGEVDANEDGDGRKTALGQHFKAQHVVSLDISPRPLAPRIA